MVENEEMRGNIMRRFESIDRGDECDTGGHHEKVGTALLKFLSMAASFSYHPLSQLSLSIQGRRDQREQRRVGRPAEGSRRARHRAEGEQNSEQLEVLVKVRPQRSEEFQTGTGRDGILRNPGIFRDRINLFFSSRD